MSVARQVVTERSIRNLANRYRLKWELEKPVLATEIIVGRAGQIYDHGDGLLAVMFLPAKEAWMPRKWGNVRRDCIAAGMTLLQDGDAEGSLSFDPSNREQAKLAIKVAEIKARRRLSDEQRERLKSIGRSSRFVGGTAQERPFSGQEPSQEAGDGIPVIPRASDT
jgi:hypothetical protein